MRLSVTNPLRSWAQDNYRDITLKKCERSEHSRVEVCYREQEVRKDGKSSTPSYGRAGNYVNQGRIGMVAWGAQDYGIFYT